MRTGSMSHKSLRAIDAILAAMSGEAQGEDEDSPSRKSFFDRLIAPDPRNAASSSKKVPSRTDPPLHWPKARRA